MTYTLSILMICFLTSGLTMAMVYHDYCVIGAGPSGLQMGYFFKKASRDYIVFERSNISGSFFDFYPRHRNLISINKRNTGKINKEFSLRHDWNSLISNDPDLLVTKYSKKFFPTADVLVKYFNDYQRKLNINVQFNTNIHNIKMVDNKTSPDGHVYTMEDQTGKSYMCRTLVVATGMHKPNVPDVKGMDLTIGYEDMSLNPEDYENKSVMILGHGNSAFEIASSINGHTSLVHLIGGTRIRLAWATHYVGDVRAVNNDVLDTYQLKSLDGLSEFIINPQRHELKIHEGKIMVNIFNGTDVDQDEYGNAFMGQGYDIAIRALGFVFDTSPFNNITVTENKFRANKYPRIQEHYESKDYKGLFFAGTVTHSLDYRKSAGGFIHGFRYTARALHKFLEWRYEGVPWPYITIPLSQLQKVLLKRINEASGLYQMFQKLGDVVIFSEDKQDIKYIEEYPMHALHELPQRTGLNGSSYLVMNFEYGSNFSGPNFDVFKEDRAIPYAPYAHLSNFIHPVLYYYKQLPTEQMMTSRLQGQTMPRPDVLHHIVEDFLTEWFGPIGHIIPLRRFLEKALGVDLRTFFSRSCFLISMSRGSTSETCEKEYMQGQGLPGTEQLTRSSITSGVMFAI